MLHIEVAVEMERKYVSAPEDESAEVPTLEPRVKALLRDAVITLASDYQYRASKVRTGKSALE